MNRSGRAMPVTTNTREFDGTTTESRSPPTRRGAPIVRVTRKNWRDAECAADAIGRGVVAGGDQRRVGRRRRVEPLAQAPGRQRPVLEIFLGDEQQVDVARQREMLKAIVEQVDGRAEPALGETAAEYRSAPTSTDDAGQRSREHQRLVAGFVEPREHAGCRRTRP